MEARSRASEEPLDVFASRTLSKDDAFWDELESKLAGMQANLIGLLGDRLGRSYFYALRIAAKKRDAAAVDAITTRGIELGKSRSQCLDFALNLADTGSEGSGIAAELMLAWENHVIESSDATRARLEAVFARGRSHLAKYAMYQRVVDFPERFAGFPFKSDLASAYAYCYPGYQAVALPGFSSLSCSKVPVPSPFTTGGATLTFLDGSLVAVSMKAISYSEAVSQIAAKYGKPYWGTFKDNYWHPAKAPSYGPNSSFNWLLNGGRIRVGRLGGAPFILFVHADNDNAIGNSY